MKCIDSLKATQGHVDKTGVSLRSMRSLHHVPLACDFGSNYPNLGPLSCWLQKRSLAQFKLVMSDRAAVGS